MFVLNIINNLFKGLVTLEIKDWGKDRLLNLCIKNNINIHNPTKTDNGIIIQVNGSDYKRIMEYNKKIKTTIIVMDKTGLQFFFYKYRKRKVFILCFLLFILGIYMLSNYIWNITIIGNEIYTKEELIKNVTDNYLQIGDNKNKVNCKDLEKKLRDDYTDIAWISCQIKGTNLIISLEETIPSHELIIMNEPCNIIAYKDSIITDIIVNNGTKLVSIGDEVSKNDILITGVVNIYNEYDELIETNHTTATGEVWGIVEYTYKDEFMLETNKKNYSGETKTITSITIGTNRIKLPFGDILYDNYDIISDINNIKIFKNLYLPIGIKKDKYLEYTYNTIMLSKNEATDLASKRLLIYIDKLKKKGVSILENNVTISIVNGKCVAQGTIICKELIGIPQPLDLPPKGDNE